MLADKWGYKFRRNLAGKERKVQTAVPEQTAVLGQIVAVGRPVHIVPVAIVERTALAAEQGQTSFGELPSVVRLACPP